MKVSHPRLTPTLASPDYRAPEAVTSSSSRSHHPDSCHPQGQLLRAALVALGPTAIKLGQTLSTRPDLVGEELCEELALLQVAPCGLHPL